MNLLPRSDIDFAKTEYWNQFFKKRGTKEFEWYGEYAELCGDLHKYLKKEDLILVIGCGNSMLSSDLFDIGFRQITSIDISSVVIQQMKNKVGQERPDMVFEQMDALNMTYEDEKFTVVLDKGTLDALMPTDTIDDRKRVEKLFSEVDRVLKVNGRYIIVSLLQSHILKQLSFFSERGWMIRISRCWDVERKKIEETGSLTIPVFMVVCVKFKRVQKLQPIMEVNVFVNGKPQRVASIEEVFNIIDGVQRTVFHCKEAKGDIEIKFCKNNQDQPRYTIYIVDVSQDQRRLLTYAAFIVPHGRESEWMFGTPEGRKCLRESSGFDRLAVIIFHRNQNYGTMDEIQDELRQTILQLAPCFMPTSSGSPKVPYLTLGDGVGRRQTVYSGSSEFSGELIVEEVEIENETFRRLIFMDNQAVVQSEVKLKKASKKNSNKKLIDTSYVASNHILYMSISVAVKTESPSLSIAVIGLGGGGLCLFLHEMFPKATITGVEIDPLVVKIAENYFGFKTNNRLKVIVKDGVEFIKQKPKFDVIMFDIDSKERGSAVSCPPPQFLDPTVLGAAAEILGDEGIFVTNVVTRIDAEFEKVLTKIKNSFKLITWYNMKEDVNRIVFASNMKGLKNEEWKQRIEDAAVALDTIMQKKNTNTQLLDIYHLINQLTIYFSLLIYPRVPVNLVALIAEVIIRNSLSPTERNKTTKVLLLV